jgi:hypothetical protein
MSMWLESLSYCLYDAGDDLELKAKCILSYLSMDVPRSWWGSALETNNIRRSHAEILHDLRKELLKIPGFPEKIDFGLLVALAFADDEKEKAGPGVGNFDNQYSLKEYLDKAKEILTARPELRRLGRLIDEIK